MTTDLILVELSKQSDRLIGIEKAISVMAVQDEKILNLPTQIGVIFKKYDEAFNPKDGVVIEISRFQKECPRNKIEKTLSRQWYVILLN